MADASISKGRRYLAECIGTFVLVFAGTGAAVINDVAKSGIGAVGVGLVFGLVVMAMIYALGDTSGAHMNPAVTVGFWAAGRFRGSDVPGYALSQAAGAVAASALMRVLFPTSQTLGATLPAGTWHQSFVLEVVLTAILMFVVMCVSTGSKEVGVMAGIAVGGVVGLEATFAGPVCGASMNPARSLGPAVVAGYPQHLWIYIVAPVVGALVGVLGWKGIRPTVAVQASLPKG